MRRTLAALVAGFMGASLGLVPTAANADAGGNKTPIEFEGTTVVNDLCGFPVTIEYQSTGHVVTVDTKKGTILRAHLNEKDVFSANGNSLTGVYTFQVQITYDTDGNVVKSFQTGVIVKATLPNGETFMVAGRADALTQSTDFVFIPTHGVTRNLDAFCAALAA
jgi:hypothetical protein